MGVEGNSISAASRSLEPSLAGIVKPSSLCRCVLRTAEAERPRTIAEAFPLIERTGLFVLGPVDASPQGIKGHALFFKFALLNRPLNLRQGLLVRIGSEGPIISDSRWEIRIGSGKAETDRAMISANYSWPRVVQEYESAVDDFGTRKDYYSRRKTNVNNCFGA